MSLTGVLESVRELTPVEQAKVRRLLDELNNKNRRSRFQKLRGSAKDENFPTLTLEDLQKERREIWQGLGKEDSEN
ncbi:MAG: hypothetical protein LH472_07440 [Pyrinomonadaceae bacterium]|nr:hypothetical protein [Pyrinomonadaceae bacterium]